MEVDRFEKKIKFVFKFAKRKDLTGQRSWLLYAFVDLYIFFSNESLNKEFYKQEVHERSICVHASEA